MDTYHIFFKTFLAESPWLVQGGNDFLAQLEMLRENLTEGVDIREIDQNVFCADLGNQRTYWLGDRDASKVAIIVDTETNGAFCKVVLTSKNPEIAKKSPPYASDLYLRIKEDIDEMNLVFTSDALLSDDAARLWRGMVGRGKKISVYDTEKNQYVLSLVKDKQDLSKFIGDHSYSKYIFVLSENKKIYLGLKHSFDIMEFKRISLYPLFEQWKSTNV
jgi:hypothetical protein